MTVPHDQGMPLVPLFDVISKGFTYLLTADQGWSIVFGPVIMGGAFRSFAMARSRRNWLATVLVMPVSRMVTRIIARMASPASRFGSRGLTAAAVLASQRPNISCSASSRLTANGQTDPVAPYPFGTTFAAHDERRTPDQPPPKASWRVLGLPWLYPHVRLVSRNDKGMTASYPELAVLADRIRAPVILDGEIVALHAGGPETMSKLATVQPNAADPDAPVVSWAVTVTAKVPSALGVPEIRPVEELIDSPGGSPVAV